MLPRSPRCDQSSGALLTSVFFAVVLACASTPPGRGQVAAGCTPISSENNCTVAFFSGGGGGPLPGSQRPEGDYSFVLPVTLRGFLEAAVVVRYATWGTLGNADEGADFGSEQGQLTFEPLPNNGVQTQLIRIPLLDDDVSEGDETFEVRLWIEEGPAVLGEPNRHLVTILDDEAGEAPSVFWDLPGGFPDPLGRWTLPNVCLFGSDVFVPILLSRPSAVPVSVEVGGSSALYPLRCPSGAVDSGRCVVTFDGTTRQRITVDGNAMGTGHFLRLSTPEGVTLGQPVEIEVGCVFLDSPTDLPNCVWEIFRAWSCGIGLLGGSFCQNPIAASVHRTSSAALQVADPEGTLHAFRDQVMAATPAGRYYTGLYESLSPTLTEALFRRPAAVFRALRVQDAWLEAIDAQVEGRGEEGEATPPMVDDLLAIIEELASADPTLRAVADFELERLRLGELPGNTFADFWQRVNEAGGPTDCQATPTALCLNADRFRLEVEWRDFQGRVGAGRAVPVSADTGYFWFFNDANVELMVKVLDGRHINDHFWVFYGALSNVAYTITVTDTETGVVRSFRNPEGRFASVGDTQAFPEDLSVLRANQGTRRRDSLPGAVTQQAWRALREAAGSLIGNFAPPVVLASGTPPAPAVGTHRNPGIKQNSCVGGMGRLCLNDSRFRAEVSWRDFAGNRGSGRAIPLSADTGYFWFFNEANVELVLKVLDGRRINGHHWVFYGALSNVEYTITVTDTETGEQRTYFNPLESFASVGDTTAFSE